MRSSPLGSFNGLQPGGLSACLPSFHLYFLFKIPFSRSPPRSPAASHRLFLLRLSHLHPPPLPHPEGPRSAVRAPSRGLRSAQGLRTAAFLLPTASFCPPPPRFQAKKSCPSSPSRRREPGGRRSLRRPLLADRFIRTFPPSPLPQPAPPAPSLPPIKYVMWLTMPRDFFFFFFKRAPEHILGGRSRANTNTTLWLSWRQCPQCRQMSGFCWNPLSRRSFCIYFSGEIIRD